MIGFLDTTAVQNLPNTVRTLYVPGTKNTIKKNHKKYKLNATGFFGVNCNSTLIFTPNTRIYEFMRILVKVKIANCQNEVSKELLNGALNHDNLTDKHITFVLKKRRDSYYTYRENINNKIYDDTTSLESRNRNIINYAKRQDPANSDKRESLQNENLYKNLNIDEIQDILRKEKRLNIVLDNYTTHHAYLVEKASELLNINLIFLPSKSPDLNPIEDVWINPKKEIFNEFIETPNQMQIIFENAYYEEVEKESYYENWVSEYLN